MNADQYVAQILGQYAVLVGAYSPAEMNANAIAPLISNWAGQWLAQLSFSGSYIKGTGVKGTTDIDLFISLRSGTPGTLADIYGSLFQLASDSMWFPRRQNVSIGINYMGVKIDLVPGRIQEGYRNYHSLYCNKRRSWTQSNIALQIDTVQKSGRINEIRAIKIWRNLNNLEFPSFYLELTVINALKGRSTDTLSANVWQVFKYISDSFFNARVVDPSNSENILSQDLTIAEKQLIVAAAKNSLKQQNWKTVIW